jgi:predicted ester cyclase
MFAHPVRFRGRRARRPGAIIARLTPRAEAKMTRQDILAFFTQRQALWQAHDPEGLARGHSPTGIVMSPMFGRRSGRDAIRDSYKQLFKMFPDWAFVAMDPIVEGDRIALPFSATATHVGEFMGLAGTNRRFQIQGVRLVEMADGLIQVEQRLYDFTGLLIQVGVLRGKPAKD